MSHYILTYVQEESHMSYSMFILANTLSNCIWGTYSGTLVVFAYCTHFYPRTFVNEG